MPTTSVDSPLIAALFYYAYLLCFGFCLDWLMAEYHGLHAAKTVRTIYFWTRHARNIFSSLEEIDDALNDDSVAAAPIDFEYVMVTVGSYLWLFTFGLVCAYEYKLPISCIIQYRQETKILSIAQKKGSLRQLSLKWVGAGQWLLGVSLHPREMPPVCC